MVEAEHIVEVATGIFCWKVFDPGMKADASSTAIETSEGLVLIDPIPLREPALSVLTGERKVAAILLTSGNHQRAAERFRTLLDAPVFAPVGAKGSLQIRVDEWIGERWSGPGGLAAAPVPSAGPGEVAYILGGILCIGDAVINFGSHGFSLLPEKYCTDSARLPNDLRKLLSYEFRILTFAHGDPVVERARERFAQLLA